MSMIVVAAIYFSHCDCYYIRTVIMQIFDIMISHEFDIATYNMICANDNWANFYSVIYKIISCDQFYLSAFIDSIYIFGFCYDFTLRKACLVDERFYLTVH